jgi:E3 ubiquitin-protein ligase DOA10
MEVPARSCRLCLGSEGEEGDASLGRLFRPCLCKGTQSFIHEECLSRWRAMPDAPALACPICKYEYRYARALLARALSSQVFAGAISAVLIIACVLLVAYFLKFLGIFVLGVSAHGKKQGTYDRQAQDHLAQKSQCHNVHSTVL